jgi:segregation and condensation protein A
MQKAAAQLFDYPQLGVDFFMRGTPEPLPVEVKPVYYLPLYDLLAALGAPQRRKKPETYDIKPTRLFSMEDSLRRLRRLFGLVPNWGVLSSFLPAVEGEDPLETKSAIASTFSAVLEMVKAGELDLRQTETFAPIYLKRRTQSETNMIQTESSEE